MMTIPHPLAQSAQAYPQRIALVMDGESLTYSELSQRVMTTARHLRAQGVQNGDRVWLSASRSIDWVIKFHAIGWCNAVAVLVDPDLGTTIRKRVRVSTGAKNIDIQPQRTEGGDAVEANDWRLDDPRLIVLTSGSTGQHKEIPLNTHQLLFNALGSALRLGHLINDRWLNCLPLFHVGGASILFRCALYGTTAEVTSDFDPQTVAERLDSGEVTQVSLVPTMLKRILDVRPQHAFPGELRVILVGGAPCSKALRERCSTLGVPIQVTWGLTEAASQVCTQVPGTSPNESAVGPPLPFSIVRIENDRLLVDGPTVSAPILTSDRGGIDKGQVTVFGRQDDLIISGGKKIAPQPICHRLMTHPAIRDAFVLGTPCPEWGERVTAILTTDVEPVPSTQGIVSWCREVLAPQDVPKTVYWVAEIPRNQLGKVNRSALRRIIRDGEPNIIEGIDESLRASARPKVRQCDEGVLQTNAAPFKPIVSTSDNALKGDRSPTVGDYTQPSDQTVTSAHRSAKAGVGMNQGETQVHGLESDIHAADRSGQHLLKADVRILKSSAKEDDPSAINFVKPGRNISFEKHKNPLDGRRTENR